eukprot:CAMPEP_0115005194 /NCGR_PEP_ID=MMETSP0216-20121206/19709_1 /TAXON_ID=223996 /ORGANISM="Protocruzia adherens, Strain Boccale" /LENGTH=491 /DNA_ID=CAMNT_0002371439 /DNA_START=78 /DNA_END=1553 /DNA_ORIENTATION=+
MPINPDLLREDRGGNPEDVRKSEKLRYRDGAAVEAFLEADAKWRTARYNLDTKKAEYNKTNKAIAEKKKASKGKDKCEEEVALAKQIDAEVKQLTADEKDLNDQLNAALGKIGNMVHESVPDHKNEDFNEVVRTWGEVDKERKIDSTPGNYHHNEVLFCIDGYDPVRGVKNAGHKGYYLKGPGFMLNKALQNFGLQFLIEKGYTPVQPPYFMKKDAMAKTAQLSDFDESLYKVYEESSSEKETKEYYLIATSEQPISCMYSDEWIEEKDLPIRYAGLSTCFRKEAGAHGKDTWGIFRVHQFEKVEQFVYTSPEKSWEMHEEMTKCAEEFYKALGLPYQIINIVSGALNDAAAKKYDLEAWFPGYGTYRELVSCSNCTDYQSRSLETRWRNPDKEDKEKRYVHMLNATLCATERTLCCVLENYQTPEGVKVPEALRPFMGGMEFIPYVKELSQEEKERTQEPKEKKKAGKKQKKPEEKKKNEETKTEETKKD